MTAAEEAASRAIVVRARRSSSLRQSVMSLLAGATAVAFPEIALATTLVGEDHDGALPPGTRTGDVLLCVPVDAAHGASLVAGRPARRPAPAAEGRAPCAVSVLNAARPPSRWSACG